MKRELPILHQVSIFINGGFGLVAITLIVIGGFISTTIGKDIDIKEFLYLNQNTEIGEGKIIDIFETSTSINDQYVYGYEYKFASPIGDLQWISYTTGRHYNIGDKVNVEYSIDHPDINRISGFSNTPGGIFSLFLFLPFIIGIIWFIINFYKGYHKNKILTSGEIAYGTLIEKRATSTEINDKTVYKLIFEYNDTEGKPFRITAKTHNPESLEDEKKEMLFYNKIHPQKAVLVDDLPWNAPEYIKNNWNKNTVPNTLQV